MCALAESWSLKPTCTLLVLSTASIASLHSHLCQKVGKGSQNRWPQKGRRVKLIKLAAKGSFAKSLNQHWFNSKNRLDYKDLVDSEANRVYAASQQAIGSSAQTTANKET